MPASRIASGRPALSQLKTSIKTDILVRQTHGNPTFSQPTSKSRANNSAGSDVAQSEWPNSPIAGSSYTTAIVKGAGPSGLAAAISLLDAGFEAPHILVVEKQSDRLKSLGEKTNITICREGLRRLHELRCLDHACDKGWITDLKDSNTSKGRNAFHKRPLVSDKPILQSEGSIKIASNDHATSDGWIIHDLEDIRDESGWIKVEDAVSYFRDDSELDEQINGSLEDSQPVDESCSTTNEQEPCFSITLGHLKDALLYTAYQEGIQIRYNSSVELCGREAYGSTSVQADRVRYRAMLISGVNGTTRGGMTDLGCPDLIVCASGEGDSSLEFELGFQKLVGLRLNEAHMPLPGSRSFNIVPQLQIEEQRFGVSSSKVPKRKIGSSQHIVPKADAGQSEQALYANDMRHAGSTHSMIYVSRKLATEDDDKNIADHDNDKIGTHSSNIQTVHNKNVLLCSDTVNPVRKEIVTAPQYASGENVVLIGGAAMGGFPLNEVGTDVGVTMDSRRIYELGRAISQSKAAHHSRRDLKAKLEALDVFNRSKARSTVIWSQRNGSFCITSEAIQGMSIDKAIAPEP